MFCQIALGYRVHLIRHIVSYIGQTTPIDNQRRYCYQVVVNRLTSLPVHSTGRDYHTLAKCQTLFDEIGILSLRQKILH